MGDSLRPAPFDTAADDRGPPSSEGARLPTELPPELRDLPEEEFRKIHAAGTLYALKKTHSKTLAQELVSDVFVKLTTTRRYDPSKGPLLPYFLRAIKSELSHRYESKADERAILAHEGFYREQHRTRESTAEDVMIERDKQLENQSHAARELAELRERIASHPLMPRVLECKSEGMQPREIALALAVSDREVYGALKLLKHHLKRIRETKPGEGEEE